VRQAVARSSARTSAGTSAEKAGSASALSETGSEMGVALGVAILGSVVTLIYRHQVAGAIPGGSATAAARDSLVGATTTAAHLPGQLGATVLGAARDAYTAGFNVAALIGAIAAVILAVLAVVLLRHIPPTGTAAAQGEPADTDAGGGTTEQDRVPATIG